MIGARLTAKASIYNPSSLRDLGSANQGFSSVCMSLFSEDDKGQIGPCLFDFRRSGLPPRNRPEQCMAAVVRCAQNFVAPHRTGSRRCLRRAIADGGHHPGDRKLARRRFAAQRCRWNRSRRVVVVTLSAVVGTQRCRRDQAYQQTMVF